MQNSQVLVPQVPSVDADRGSLTSRVAAAAASALAVRKSPGPAGQIIRFGWHFIEARLHTDGEKNIERIQELQEELAHSVATPLYLILDPQTNRHLGGPLGGVTTPGTFRKFLLDAVDSKERVGRLDDR